MTELKYDPELPFVVLDFGGHVIVRFADKPIAEWFARNHVNYKKVIDTTPKPKIPEDAEFVYVELKDGPYYIRKRYDGSWEDHTKSQFVSTDHLERFLNGEGDAEVTILVRKEGS